MALTKISTGGVKDDTADEAKLKVSNAGSNGQFLQKQSGNTGGLTWATVSVPDSDKIEEGNTSVETVDTGSDGNVSIKTEGTERVKIRNDGVVDIGGSTGSNAVNLNVKGTDGSGAGLTGNVGKVNIGSSYSNVPNAENIALGQLLFGHGTNASGPIIEGASGGLWSTNNLPSALKFYTVPASSTTQTERFRISKDGSLGVGGANYGTSGQVLTSGGNAAAPSWAAVPPGGNSVDLVADGAIAAGKPCIIKSNGKAQQVQLVQTGKTSVDSSNTPSGSTGNTYTDQGVHGGESRMAYDPITKKIVLITKGHSAGDIYYQIGTENSSNNLTIDWTTKVELWGDNENNYYETSDLVYAGNSRFLYVWTLNSGKSVVKIGKATSSGFSWSSAIDLYATDSKWKGFNCVKLTDDRIALLAKAMSANGPSGWEENHPGILIIDITSDTAFSYRNFTQLDTSTCKAEKENNTLSYDTTNGILFATWETSSDDSGTAGIGRCCALKVAAGTSATITKSSSNVQIDTTIAEQDACYHAGQDKFLIAYEGEVGVNAGTEVKVATVNSTSLAVTLADGAVSTRVSVRGLKINEGLDGQILMTLVDVNRNMWTSLSTDFAGSSFTFTAPSLGREVGTTYSGHWYYFEQLFIPDFGTAKNLLVMSGGGLNDYGVWYTYKTSSETSNITTSSSNSVLNYTNILGFAEDAISNGNTGTIKLPGNVVGNQSGLTAGTFYYHQANGTLGTSGDGDIYNAKAGTAISSTKLLIKDPNP